MSFGLRRREKEETSLIAAVRVHLSNVSSYGKKREVKKWVSKWLTSLCVFRKKQCPFTSALNSRKGIKNRKAFGGGKTRGLSPTLQRKKKDANLTGNPKDGSLITMALYRQRQVRGGEIYRVLNLY